MTKYTNQVLDFGYQWAVEVPAVLTQLNLLFLAAKFILTGPNEGVINIGGVSTWANNAISWGMQSWQLVRATNLFLDSPPVLTPYLANFYFGLGTTITLLLRD